jgi:metallo-beta-lactamase class B
MFERRKIANPWEGKLQPFRIIGNVYFVGTFQASSHLVDTGEGLILIDPGYSNALYLVIRSIYELGFNPKDIKYIINTHWHWDHTEATAALAELSGAKTLLGKDDLEKARRYFEPDILLKDGDTLTLGNTTITAMATPGHTPGAMSYFFDVEEDGEVSRVGLHGGMGINTMCREFLDKYNLSYDCREQFQKAMDRLAEEHVDIFLGNHMQHNDTAGKYRKIMAGDKRACINPDEWAPYCRWAKQNLLNMIAKENAEV